MSKKTVTLNLKDMCQNIRKAIAEHRLQAVILDDMIASGDISWQERSLAKCRYRIGRYITAAKTGPCGCAIGVNIPDEDYLSDFENVCVNAIIVGVNKPTLADNYWEPWRDQIEFTMADDHGRGLLGLLQVRHDLWANAGNQAQAEECRKVFMEILEEAERVGDNQPKRQA